ncbi:sensor protein BasS/PmrB [Streptomyces sp. YIM 130001]|nr:sensor protein BasS/PmrB [Streptomyces sp. YIM 130001]
MRAKIVCLLMVPVVSLLALWAYATVTTAQDVARLRTSQQVDEDIRRPVADAVTQLQAERTLAVRHAADPGPRTADALEGQAAKTDTAVGRLRVGDRHTVADGTDVPAGVAARLGSFVDAAGGLGGLRDTVLDRSTGWDEAYSRYTRTISDAFKVGGALSGIQDAELGSHARVVLEFERAAEMLAREDVLIVLARHTGSLEGAGLREFTGAAGARSALTASAADDLPADQRQAWRQLAAGSAYGGLRAVEGRVLAAPAGQKAADAADTNGARWDAAHATVRDSMREIAQDAAGSAADRADPFARGVLTAAGAAVLFGLLAVVASLVISVRIGRALVVELVSLRNSALEIARHKLPQAMQRLRQGAELDIRAEAPPGPPAEDETGQVSEALGTMHRAALRAAVERAELASGISGVFVNLARRSQVLVHRQLNLLDSMERRADDPGELSDLFRLDHLTTRMRRHAESLIILSGAAPGRAWRMPVSLTNVVRAAVSEVEDYARVEVRQLSEAAVVGGAVADLTHLLAEILENAAQFSPPHTKVRVSGEPVGNGYAVEVEDRGLGMGKERLAEANRRIEQSEALDLFDSDRLGLFVVSRLAARHGIKVHLRTSPYGGTTAVVLLPTTLLQSSVEAGTVGRRAAAEQGAESHHDARVPAPTAARLDGPPPEPARPALAATTTPRGVTTLRLHTRAEDGASGHERAAPSAPAHTGPAPADSAPAGEADPAGLPRRVRQASLAPQLRDEPAPDVSAVHPQGDDERSPEQVRDRMAAYRAGWTRGGGRPAGAGEHTPVDVLGLWTPTSDSDEGDTA